MRLYKFDLTRVWTARSMLMLVTVTNIDWKAYMEQVETFLDGERDYRKIRGDTGPLV